MLHGLEQVDWGALEHAYGDASDVPAHLRALQSPSPEEREHALHDLFGSIWHQGTVYSASGPAATFLIALVADPATPDRAAILALLEALATGSGYLEVHEEIMEKDELAAICAEQGITVEDLRARERRDVEAAHLAVSAGLAVYDELLFDPDPQVRGYALQLLAALPEHAHAIVPRLRSLLPEEGDPGVRLGLAMALHILADDSPQSCAVFNAVLAESTDAVTRLIAAVALATREQDRTPPQVLELLVQAAHQAQTDRSWLQGPDDGAWSLARGHLPAPWHGSLVALIIAAFQRLGPTLRAQLFARALARAEAPEVAQELAVAYLADTFEVDLSRWGASWGPGLRGGWRISYHLRGTVPPLVAARLTDRQRGCLAALLAADTFWRNETNLLELFGLPTARDALRSWVADARSGARV